MKCLYRAAIAVPFAAAMLLAQAPKTFTGTIVDANCKQAAALGSIAASSADPTTRTSSSKTKSVESVRRDMLRSCAPAATTTAFAILTDDGNFLKLDEKGNTQVKNNKLNGRNTKVTVTGSASGDSLAVETIGRM